MTEVECDSHCYKSLTVLISRQPSAEFPPTYAALILGDDGIEITVSQNYTIQPNPSEADTSSQSDKILALTSAASVDLEPIWASLLAKALEGKNVKDFLSDVGAGSAVVPAVGGAATVVGVAAVEEPKEQK